MGAGIMDGSDVFFFGMLAGVVFLVLVIIIGALS
jgi:hypothetical protein